MAFLNRIQRLWQNWEGRRRSERQARRRKPKRSLYRLETLEPRLLLAGDVVLTPIALEGMAAPGTEAGVVFAGFESPVIDDAAQVSFVGSITGPGVRTAPTEEGPANSTGIWASGSNPLSIVFRQGETDVFTTLPLGDFFSLIAAGNGQLAFSSILQGELLPSIFTGDVGGDFQPVAHIGDSVQILGETLTIESASLVGLNAAGQVAYNAVLADPIGFQSDSGWVDSMLVNRSGDQAADVPAGLLWPGGGMQFVNDGGGVAFFSGLLTGPLDFRQVAGVWAGAPGNLQLDPVVRSQPDPFNPNNPVPDVDLAPGTGVEWSLNGFTLLGFNNAGQVVVGGAVNRPGLPQGLWVGAPNSLSLIALEGETVADPTTGAVFSDTPSGFQDVLMNGQGQVVFRSEMTGPGITASNNEGIWITEGGSLKRIVREGDPAPNVPGSPNATFTNISSALAINNLGQVVFQGGIRLDDQTAVDSLWMYDPQMDELFLLLQDNQVIDVNGTARSITNWTVVSGSGEGGKAASFSDQGVLALRLDFPDFGGAAEGIYTVQVVPEPPESNTYTWAGGLDNRWWSDTGDFTNWVDENGNRHEDPPNSPDHVVIIGSADIIIERLTGPDTFRDTAVESITVTSATSNLRVLTPLNITLDSTFGTLQVLADVTVFFGENVIFNGGLELLDGTFVPGPVVSFTGGADALLVGGVWKVEGDAQITGDGGGDNVLKIRGGQLEKTGLGQAEIAIPVETSVEEPAAPVIKVLEGTLKLAAGGQHQADLAPLSTSLVYEASLLGTLILGGHSDFAGHFTIGGEGIIRTDDTTQLNIGPGVPERLDVFSAGPGWFELAGGTINATGVLSIHGPMRWSSGTIRGGEVGEFIGLIFGGLLVDQDGTLAILPGGSKHLEGIVGNLAGIVSLSADLIFDGGTCFNYAQFLFNSGRLINGSDGFFFNDSGRVIKSGGGEAIVEVRYVQRPDPLSEGFDPPALLRVESGNLRLLDVSFYARPLIPTEVEILGGSTLSLAGDTVLQDSVQILLDGTLLIGDEDSGRPITVLAKSTLTLKPGPENLLGTAILQGGTLTLAGTVENEVNLALSEGTLNIDTGGRLINRRSGKAVVDSACVEVGGRLINEGELTLRDSPNFLISNEGLLRNEKDALLHHEEGFNIDLIGNRDLWLNEGRYELRGTILSPSDGTQVPKLVNRGQVILDRSNGTVLVGGDMDNNGTIEVTENTSAIVDRALDQTVSGASLSKGTWIVHAGADLELTGASGEGVPPLSSIGTDAKVILHGSGKLNNLPLTPGQTDIIQLLVAGDLELRDGVQWLGGLIDVSGGNLVIGDVSRILYTYDPGLANLPGFVAAGKASLVVDFVLSVGPDVGIPGGAHSIFIGPEVKLSGHGTINGNAIVNGKIASGDSPGTLTFESDLTLGETAILELEAAGTGEGEADLLQVLGDLELGGEVRFAFINGFAPTAGQTFTFIDVDGQIAGAFDSTRIVGLDSGFQFEAGFDETGMLTLAALSDGISLPAAIRGIVFDDQNGNGLFDSSEPGRSGLTVHLQPILPDGSLGDEATTTTDSTGQYNFGDLAAGDYRVSVDEVPGTLATTLLSTDVEAQNGVILVGFEGQAELPDGDSHLEEVETTLAFGSALMDFGDAPDPTYPTLLDFDGARHTLMPGLHLGSAVDSEEDGKPSDNASADAGDDGVIFGLLQLGKIGQVTINVALPVGVAEAKLDAWIDWNADGTWDNETERIAESLAVVGGDNLLDIDVPSDASIGLTFARFRLSTEGAPEPTGLAGAGEVEDYQIEVKPRSATIGTGANKAFIYTDADGTTTTITLKGSTASVFYAGDNLEEEISSKGVTVTGQNIEITEIILADTTPSSSLTFKTKGGDGFSSVGKITGDDPLGKLTGKGIDLVGEGVVMSGDGYINTIYIHGTQNGADIIMPGTGSTGITVKAGTLGAGTDINLGSGLKSLTAAEWDGSALIAPWASKITIKGDMGADLNLSGAGNPALTLGTLTVKGSAHDAFWDIVGNVGKVSVTGAMEDVEMGTMGNVTSFRTGALRHSTIFAGVANEVTVDELPDSNDDFDVVAEIKTLTIKGISGSAEPSFLDSRVAAMNLGKVSLKDIQSDNEGIPFGFAADKITSYKRDSTKLSKLDTPAELDGQDDYIVKIL